MRETGREIKEFEQYLYEQEKSRNTVDKYMRDARRFLKFLDGRELDRGLVLEYKEELKKSHRISSINSMLIALNSYLRYIGREECCVRTYRQQRQIFRDDERELSRTEYQRLLLAARASGNTRLYVLLQTLAGTGIRIGELHYVTVEALWEKKVQINFKGKLRVIVLPQSLSTVLKDYCRKRRIRSGSIFVSKSGRPLDRRNVWAEMKRLCQAARVQATKVFPHNLRHLFAKCFYEKEKDLGRLADYMGHSSVETTRRYTMLSSMEACGRQLELGLVVCERE